MEHIKLMGECKCKVCGGHDVEVKAFINQLTEIVDYSVFEDADTWCNDCEDHTGIIIIDENGNVLDESR